ncbi:UNVERIFIED_CONTAM: hypothetical protein H355_013452, partial [Colinus virginianus]
GILCLTIVCMVAGVGFKLRESESVSTQKTWCILNINMDIRGAVDAAVPTNIIAAKAAEVRANKVNWQSYLQ